MSIHRQPHLDLHGLSEKLADIPEVEDTTIDEDGLHVRLEKESIQINSPGGLDQSTERRDKVDPDRVLYPVGRGFLEFTIEEILLHEFDESSRYNTLLIEIINGVTDDEVMETEVQ